MSNTETTATTTAVRSWGGYTNAETLTVIRCIDNDARSVEAAAAIVADAWTNASDAVATDRAAIVAPREDAADALRAWIEEEENPLADANSLYTDLITRALDRVNWGEVADHYAPKPLPSIEPLPDPEDDAEEAPEEAPEEQEGPEPEWWRSERERED